MDDRQIIELYNQRDENAIKETSDKYGNYCFSIANNILDCKQDSEECVNDTWLQTWNSIPPQKPNCLKAFLAKITRNLSLNRYKEKTRDKRGNGEVVLALDEMDEFLAGAYSVPPEHPNRQSCASKPPKLSRPTAQVEQGFRRGVHF